jgi:hypothetical protein
MLRSPIGVIGRRVFLAGAAAMALPAVTAGHEPAPARGLD